MSDEHKPNKIIHSYKVAKIARLIDKAIQLRVEQLATFVQLKKAIEHRTFHGQLHQSDLDYIRQELEKMPMRKEDQHAAVESNGVGDAST